MKLFSSYALPALVLTLANSSAEACSPPPDRMYVQGPELQIIVGSREVYSKLRTLGAKAIQSISFNGGTYIVTATN